MSRLSDFITPGELTRISNLQMVARQVVEGFYAGLHRSPHKGFSIEFAQHRPYVQGDEIRRLDWKVFGKTDRFYVREFEEETNLRATIILDQSGSMSYEGEGVSKHHYGSRLAASLAYMMLQQRDSVGLVTFDSKVRSFVPPRSGVRHLRILLDAIKKSKPRGETRMAPILNSLIPRLSRRGLLIIISDCFENAKELVQSLAQFRVARHEVLVFQIMDRHEIEFPFKNWAKFESTEQEDTFRMIDPAHFRATYLENLKQVQKELTDGLSRHRIDLDTMITDQPYAEALARYMIKRQRRAS